MARPIALVGFMGSGKTSAGEQLAKRLGRDFADLDGEIEEAVGMTVQEVFEREGEPAFRQLEANQLTAELLPDTVLALGGGTPMNPDSWRLIRRLALSIWLDAPADVLWERLPHPGERPLARDRDAFERLLNARRRRYAESDHRVDASRPLPEVIEALVAICGR